MKQEFSPEWKASSQPRKQRKYRANASLHTRHKMISAHLSKELRTKYKRRSFPVRKGDTVKVMNGEFKKKTGKITLVSLKKLKVQIEGIQAQKKDGTKVKVWFDPSNLLVTDLVLEDKQRLHSLNKGQKSESKETKQEKR